MNAEGHREILGLQVTSAEDGAGWLDVVSLLDAHLDPAVDDSHVVRSVCGMYFGVLATRLGSGRTRTVR